MNSIINLLSALKEEETIQLAIEKRACDDGTGDEEFIFTAVIMNEEARAIVGVSADICDAELFERLTVNMLARHRDRARKETP